MTRRDILQDMSKKFNEFGNAHMKGRIQERAVLNINMVFNRLLNGGFINDKEIKDNSINTEIAAVYMIAYNTIKNEFNKPESQCSGDEYAIQTTTLVFADEIKRLKCDARARLIDGIDYTQSAKRSAFASDLLSKLKYHKKFYDKFGRRRIKACYDELFEYIQNQINGPDSDYTSEIITVNEYYDEVFSVIDDVFKYGPLFNRSSVNKYSMECAFMVNNIKEYAMERILGYKQGKIETVLSSDENVEE